MTGGRTLGRLAPGLLAAAVLLTGSPAEGAGTTVRVARSDAREIVLEVATESLEIRTVLVDGRSYREVRIPGGGLAVDPGRPALPVCGALVAVPWDSEPVLEAEALESRDLGALEIPPAPRYHSVEDEEGFTHLVPTYTPDPSVYASAAAFPGRLAEIASVSAMRFQRAALLRFYPVSWQPRGGRAVLHSRIRVRILLKPTEGAGMKTALPPREDLWEAHYRSALVNFDSAAGWARAPYTPWKPAPSEEAEFLFKIHVDSSGVYRVTRQELADLGWVKEIETDSLALFQRGYEEGAADPFTVSRIPIEVRDVDGDGRFDGEDDILFFARSFREQWMVEDWEDRFTDLNVYWLGTGEPGQGRMGTVSLSITDCDSEALFWTWRRDWFEEEHVFDYVPSRLNKDRTHWTVPTAREVDLAFRAGPVDPAEPCSLRVHYEDAWDGDGISHVLVELHNPAAGALALGELTLPNHGPGTKTFEIGAGMLTPGENHLILTGYRQTGTGQTPGPGAGLDWFDLAAPCSLIAEGGRLDFRIRAHEEPLYLRVAGFSSPEISLFDVSDAAAPRRVAFPQSDVTAGPQGGYDLCFRDSASVSGRRWVAVEESAYRRLREGWMEPARSSSLKDLEADYLILCPEAFQEELAPLVEKRRADGYEVGVVPIADVYDAFGGGFKSTDAIKRYVRFAFERWERKPQFLLLVGDASEDHKGVLEDSDPDWVPTENVPDWVSFRAASDNVYGCIDGDDLLDVFVGRLPVGSPEELRREVAKILAYEAGEDTAPWRRRVILAADDTWSTVDFGPYTQMSSERGFEETMKEAGSILVGSESCRAETLDFYLASYTGRTGTDGYHRACFQTADALTCVRDSVYHGVTGPLVDLLNDGCLLFSYLGHGFRRGMAHELILADGFWGAVDGVSRWRNDISERFLPTGRPFFCAGFGCLLANFHPPREATEGDVVLEKLLSFDGGGAVGCLGSSTSEVLQIENGYAEAFFSTMFGGPGDASGSGECGWVVGELAAASAARYLVEAGDPGAVERRILLGDPALTLRSRSLSFEVFVNGDPMGPGEGIVVPADSTTARIRALLPRTLVAGPDSLWVEIRDASGTTRLVAGSGYTVAPDSLDGVPQYAVEIEHAVRLSDYRVVLGALTRHGWTLTREIAVALRITVTLDGTPVSSNAPATVGSLCVVHAVFPWALDPGSFALGLGGSAGVVPLEAEVVSEAPDRENEWTFRCTLPPVAPGSYTLVLDVRGERLEILNLMIHSRLTIEDVVAYPCPFSIWTSFVFQLSAEANVRVDIFTVSGHRVRTLSAEGAVGQNALEWNGRDQEGDRVANGTYLYRITARRSAEKAESPVGRVTAIR